jgi:uroporphyrinogen decarboxylase
MTRREIVRAALEHRETDPIPYSISLTSQALAKLIEATGDSAVYEKLGSYLTCVDYSGRPAELPGRPEYFLDDFGVLWNRTGVDKDIGVIEAPVIADLEQQNYSFPVVDTDRLRGEFEVFLNSAGDKFTVIAFGFSMFERSWTLMGMENVLMNMITCPEALEEFYDRIADFWIPLLDLALEYDVDAVQFGDDWGQQKGLIMGPDHWRRFIKPRMARLYQRVKAKGKYVIQHSCGDCHEIFPDLIEIGLDCYQTFQPEIYDIALMKKCYGKRLTFWGGVSTQRCLPYMNRRQVQQEIARVTAALRSGGGLIIAPTHAVPSDVPAENILAMAEVFGNQERFFGHR